MAVVALASTAGAAWLGEYLMAKLQPAMQAAAEVRRLRSRLRDVRREERRAERFLDQTTEASTDWDDEATRRRALHAIRTRKNRRDPNDGSDSDRS